MLARELRQLSHQLVRELSTLDHQYQDLSVTPAQAQALMEIDAHGPLTVSQLKDILLVDKSNASRTLTSLVKKQWVIMAPNPDDKRSQLARLTEAGQTQLIELHQEMDWQLNSALSLLTDLEQAKILDGLQCYRETLAQAREQHSYKLRSIKPEESDALLSEFEEMAISSLESAPLTANLFQAQRAGYWVIEDKKDQLVGGGGLAPLDGGDEFTCELKGLFFLPAISQKGFERRLLQLACKFARAYRYRRLYLSLPHQRKQTIRLYEAFGFQRLNQPLGETEGLTADALYLVKVL